MWKDEAPYWRVEGCPSKAFTTNETLVFMKDRTFYVMGNSVSRQVAFSMYELLGGETVAREDQRDACPKYAKNWEGASCLRERNGIKIKYLFKNNLNGFDSSLSYLRPDIFDLDHNGIPQLVEGVHLPSTVSVQHGNLNAYGHGHGLNDACGNSTTLNCFQTFFAGSKETDILVFTLGFTYPLPDPDTEWEDRTTAVDTTAWLVDSAPIFKQYLEQSFKGTIVWVSIAPIKSSGAWNNPPMNDMLKRTNTLLWQLWRPRLETRRKWIVIDQWKINQGRDHLYRDEIHFPGPMSTATVFQFLTKFCQQ